MARYQQTVTPLITIFADTDTLIQLRSEPPEAIASLSQYLIIDNFGTANTSNIIVTGSIAGGNVIIDTAFGSCLLIWSGALFIPIAKPGSGGGGSGITCYELGTATVFPLPDGTAVNQTVLVFDNLGLAETNTLRVTGNFNVGSSVIFTQPGQAILFIWNGSVWNVPSWLGVLNG